MFRKIKLCSTYTNSTGMLYRPADVKYHRHFGNKTTNQNRNLNRNLLFEEIESTKGFC